MGKGLSVITAFGPLLLALGAAPALAAAGGDAPPPILFTNAEQVYFAGEAGAEAPPWVGMKLTPTPGGPAPFRAEYVDKFGAAVPPPAGLADPAIMLDAMPGGDRLTLASGLQQFHLRRARPVTCWVAIPKRTPRADGRPDWFFANDIRIHDQGGRALVADGAADTDALVIRMRNVVWPDQPDGRPSRNRPSLVLYVHKPDQPDRAESYAWADPDAARVGINLRWMQASCTVDGKE